MTKSGTIGALVAALPEKYQPIYAHPELSDGSSRGCEDRLILIRECARQLSTVLGRPLRVLDLGCAQGFFSLSLAAEGHSARGVDFLDLNVNVCNALADEHPQFNASFEHGNVEDVIERLQPGEYDLVLGLSVFHHLVHERGIASVAALCRKLSEVVGVGIYELALREEPLYWGPSLPQDPAELLTSYAFIRMLARQATHLSTIARPLYFASSRYWSVADQIGSFDKWSGESHAHGRGTHQYSRRYYFGESTFVKKMSLGLGGRAEINRQEFNNEVAFLRQPPAGYTAPRLIAELNDASDVFLVREMMPGRLLSELIDENLDYDADRVVADLLDQLVTLERDGLYHNDVRCWNVLMSPEGGATLIDYGAISTERKDCSWLEDLLLSFLITTREILERVVVSASPAREPALDFMGLPPRYRNAFVQLFVQESSRWTFAELRRQLAEASTEPVDAPEWTAVYQHLQKALLDYNLRLGRLVQQSEHDQAALAVLAARAANLEQAEESAASSRQKLDALQAEINDTDRKYQELQHSSEQLTTWATDLEAQALRAKADVQIHSSRALELDAANAELTARIGVLESQLEEQQQALEFADKQLQDAEQSCREMNERANELEARAARFEGDSQQLGARVIELEEVNASLAARLVELELELDERQRSLEEAELLAVDVARLTSERDALQVEIADASLLSRQQLDTIADQQAKLTALLQRMGRFELSKANDRRRLKELQLDISQGVQTVGAARQRVHELEVAVDALERQITRLHASRSWRITAPLRWFMAKVLRRGGASDDASGLIRAKSTHAVASHDDLMTPADTVVDKKLAALDQIASRIRRMRH
ncbi:methyltransferase domain-containing protein [Stenotrophomonas maltophilia]|uniref:methyltransferase domain-containing protein n=1 Tax=Stenotrophomonas maltophilia TaxID=40324 RepID=UPI0022F4012A|nr:methyltransferase domain-containing protein [Stenotrophomonas maltophilia]MDA5343713.1 methyltransferase domain-containing protein [Stenotrophomonas maltophilia]